MHTTLIKIILLVVLLSDCSSCTPILWKTYGHSFKPQLLTNKVTCYKFKTVLPAQSVQQVQEPYQQLETKSVPQQYQQYQQQSSNGVRKFGMPAYPADAMTAPRIQFGGPPPVSMYSHYYQPMRSRSSMTIPVGPQAVAPTAPPTTTSAPLEVIPTTLPSQPKSPDQPPSSMSPLNIVPTTQSPSTVVVEIQPQQTSTTSSPSTPVDSPNQQLFGNQTPANLMYDENMEPEPNSPRFD